MSVEGLLRIGELSRRAGVSPELLRAWERRYQLLEPTRSAGGLRLYSAHDLARVQAMQRHLAAGVAAAEAAVLARGEDASDRAAPSFDAATARADLGAALEAFDEPSAHAVLDRLLAAATLDVLLSDVVMPYLRDLGDRWERGEVSVAQEHFASNVLRGRLLGLGRDWGRGIGPSALLACVSGERHDLGLIAFGLALRARGWRIAFLGADTPMESIAGAASSLEPDAVVVSAVKPDRLAAVAEELTKLAERQRLYVGGSGAGGVDADRLGAVLLVGGPVEEAERLTQSTSRARRPATSSSASSGTSERT